VLAHYAEGEKSETVAHILSLSKNTVNTYVARIRDKYRAAGRPAGTRGGASPNATRRRTCSRYPPGELTRSAALPRRSVIVAHQPVLSRPVKEVWD